MNLDDIKSYKKLPFYGVVLPEIQISTEQRAAAEAPEASTNIEFLTQLCRKGFKEKLSKLDKSRHKEYGDRVKFELDTIDTLGFTNYILMVWDICNFAEQNKIPRGPGRGSVSSSLVCNLIGITEVDPIEHGLFFTRFLSKARAKYQTVDGIRYVDGSLTPDVDMDFDYYRRYEILDYLNSRYPGQTSKLLTTTTFSSKILIKDVLKTFEGATEEQAAEASNLVEKEAGIPEEIEDAISDDEKKQNANFKKWAENHKETVEIAMGLSGLNRSEGVHASALLICNSKISDLMPLQLSAEKDGEKQLVSGYDMYSAQEIVLKFDILGLKTLSVIQDACNLIGFDKHHIDIHHSSIYDGLQNFNFRYGVFQLETFAQGNAAAKIKVKNFDQLAACLAIARPGAFAYLDQYCAYVHNGTYTPIHTLVDAILKPTGGVCLYQEQYLAMLISIGMTPDEAEAARKVLGKKLKDKVPEVIAKIEAICAKNNHPRELVDVLVKIAYDSGGYQFAKAHSVAYAMITAHTLYLKNNYPLQFYWALLRMSRHESDGHNVIAQIEKEMRMHGYKLLPPHLTKSEIDFKIVDEKSIRFALGMIRGVSEKSMEKLESFRNNEADGATNKFKMFQAIKNAGLNIGIGSALIQAGCLEGYGVSRSRAVLELCTWNLLTDREKTICMSIGEKPEVRWDVLNAIVYLRDNKDENGKPLFSRITRFGTIKKKYEPYKEIYEMNRRNEKLANYFYERTILGYSYSENIRDIFGEEVDGLTSINEARTSIDGDSVRTIGFVKEPYRSKTKAGNDGFKMTVTDETGEITVRFFNKVIDRVADANGRLPEEEDLVIIEGKKKGDETVFADKVGIQSAKIYMKLSELKDKSESKVEL